MVPIMQGPRGNQLYIWRHFRVELPSDWEMLQFTRELAAGRCAFADRYQFRLEMCWRSVAGPPDFPRMISDYESKLQQEGMKEIRHIRAGDWTGIEGKTDGAVASRLGRYFPGQKCVIELVFLWPDGQDKQLMQEIASTFAELPAHGDLDRWRAFGMDIRVPCDMNMEKCSVLPANAELVFSHKKGPEEYRFARRGMVREWLTGPINGWARAWLSREGVEIDDESVRTTNGHELFLLRGRQPSDRIFVKHLKVQAAAWICPNDNRIYGVTHFYRDNRTPELKPEELTGGRLSCCRRLS